MKLVSPVLVSILLATAGAACGSGDQKAPPAVAQEPAKEPPASIPAKQAPPGAARLNDAQIAAVVVVANQVDIDAGALAVKKASHPEVKKLAERMVTDHSGVNKAAGELAARLHVTPEPTDASRALKAGGEAKLRELDRLDGAAFDKAYVDNEVAYHEAVIGVLDKQLIPSATNAELETMLVDVRPAFVAHLEHAKQVQTALSGQAPAGHAGAH